MAVQKGGGIHAAIKAIFVTSFKSAPDKSGDFLHVSSAKVTYDSSKPAGERVDSIRYKNNDATYVDVEAAANYTIATNAFTAKGGVGYDVLAAYAEGRATDFGLSN